ncbi:hypothetical protein CPB86DRAFT_316461 [Serendipita vermifera]|nr:hypothetical protein CPB86DRAFT_316461 [Serendipita vermifera]
MFPHFWLLLPLSFVLLCRTSTSLGMLIGGRGDPSRSISDISVVMPLPSILSHKSSRLQPRQESAHCCSTDNCCGEGEVCFWDSSSSPSCCPQSLLTCTDAGCECCYTGTSCGNGTSEDTATATEPPCSDCADTTTPVWDADWNSETNSETNSAQPTATSTESTSNPFRNSIFITVVIPILSVLLSAAAVWIGWLTYRLRHRGLQRSR